MFGLRDHYDVAFSIGGGCACSQMLRRAGMQFASFPFDWAGVKRIPTKLEILADDFRTILSREHMEFVEPNTAKDKDVYINKANGMLFLHDFPRGVPIAEAYDEVAEKYRRRGERLLSLISKSKHVLVVHVCIPSYTPHEDAEFLESYEIIRRRFSGVEFDFLSIHRKPDARSPAETSARSASICFASISIINPRGRRQSATNEFWRVHSNSWSRPFPITGRRRRRRHLRKPGARRCWRFIMRETDGNCSSTRSITS